MDSKIIKIAAINTLSSAVQGLNQLKNEAIDDQFVGAVEAIFKSKGRVVVCGIGKSALVGQKIVATLNSTGSPALFMHAADAIHGDLGMIQDNDLVLCISKSGQTPEIKVLLPFLTDRQVTILGMTAFPDSLLGKKCDYLLKIPDLAEGDPNNLAPTTSTTCQMALGDALASALQAVNGFSASHFAKFHPGGALGKKLYLTINDLIEPNNIPVVVHSASLKDCIFEMTSKRLGATAVVDHSENLIGIITDGDLRRMLEREGNWSKLTAKDIMTAKPKTIEPNLLAMAAMTVLRKYSISQLVVAKNEKVLGFIHIHDLIKEGIT